jgi:hypothetical protein
LAERLAVDRDALVQAKAADLFVGPAAQVMLFFTDLLGCEALYNRPGVVSEDNWSLRIGPDFARHYQRNLQTNRAINLPRALATALRARGQSVANHQARLLADLDHLAKHP